MECKNDWLQLKGGFNWYSFNFLHVYFEYDKWMEGLELELYVLGFGIYIRYNLPASDKIFAEYKKEVDKIIKKHGKK